ncbi:hypothetical protein RMAECT_1259 [Rickettsia rhipicephali str. Ect]|uniref:Uncharacterized protein n=1 Tax=Rickettsia rhipicephali str. Ect TaxID=1359199 RepID=A0A0F3PHL2_RICRH|nr:hypothetical protein RMAECT_1259 [Rickettsia rhipicephali str. Ect]
MDKSSNTESLDVPIIIKDEPTAGKNSNSYKIPTNVIIL